MEEAERTCCREPSGKRMVFSKAKLVVTEGWDEYTFFPRLLKILKGQELVSTIDFRCCESKNNLDQRLKSYTELSEFEENVRSIGIIIDANGVPSGFEPSFQKAQNALQKIGFPVPQRAGERKSSGEKSSVVWIMPDNSANGEFEDLCLMALEEHPLMVCATATESCVGGIQPIENRSKSILYTILAWLGKPGRRMDECSDGDLTMMKLDRFRPLIEGFFDQL